MKAATQTLDNALVVEFLAQHNPELIKQWHSHVGINALKQLAAEFNPPEPAPVTPEYPLIDERLVYQFIDSLVDCGNSEPDLLFGTFDYKDLADFFEKTPNAKAKEQLFQIWRDGKDYYKDYYKDEPCFLSQYDCEVAA
jgi:hypothetical protein